MKLTDLVYPRRIIKRTIYQTRRYREIAGVLVKYGFSGFLTTIKLEKRFKFIKKWIPRKADRPLTSFSRNARIRMTFEELGPTFIKFGQLLSMRRDLLPLSLIEELEKLQDEVPPFPGEKAHAILEEELGRRQEEIFRSFELEPVASASIAQVHRGVLPGGQVVAVKIRRPGIEEIIRSDIEILYNIASLMERYIPNMELFRPRELVREFEKQISRELDFSLELINIQQFQELFGDEPGVHVPRVFRDYSTPKVLTLEYIEGLKIARIMEKPEAGIDKKAIARKIADFNFRQVFLYGFFHADPHPGNIKIMDEEVVCYLDFGIIGRISPQQQDHLGRMMFGLARRNPKTVARSLLALSLQSEAVDRAALEARIFELMEKYIELPLEYIEITSMLNDLVGLVLSFSLRLPTGLNLIIKNLITVEGLTLSLDPEFQIIELIENYARKMLIRRFRPKKIAEDLSQFVVDYSTILQDLPEAAEEIVNLIRRGRLKINFQPSGLESFRSILDRVSNRLVAGIVLAALLISSSLIVLSGVSPKWRDIPVIGLAGYLLAGVMGLGLLISIAVKGWRKR